MQFIVNLLAILTMAAQAAIAGGIIFLFLSLITERVAVERAGVFISRFALPSAFLVALIATSGSLYFSEILGWTPCKLCWLQRIFFYPQVIILGLALIYKDKTVWRYIMPLSLVGAIIAFYQYLIQLYPAPTPLCTLASPESCSEIVIRYYGYITIPLMAFTAFLLNIIISLFALKRDKLDK